MAILDLPTDVLTEIFAQVPHLLDVLACELACRYFHQIIKDSTRLEYRIELGKSGMIDNPHCNLTTSTRLEMLRQREAAWGGFNWKIRIPHVDVPSTLIISSPMQMVTSVSVMLGLVDLDSPRMGGAFGKTTGFQAITLPSVLGEDVSLVWKMVDTGEEIFQFGAAAEEHDLLAYIAL